MERRKALAAATAATFVLGSGIVAAASVTGASFLGFGGGSKPSNTVAASAQTSKRGVVVKTRNIYDRYVVATDDGATTGAASTSRDDGAAVGGRDPLVVGAPTTTGPGPGPSADDSTPISNPPASRPGKARTTPTTTHATTPTTQPDDNATPLTTSGPSPTTTVPTTTTTWPRGVPKDWPKNKPIPPMPANCRDPQLEDNGVWNCDH